MPNVRAATTSDLPSILAIYNEVIATSTAVYALEPATLDERQAWFTSRSASGFPIVVAADPDGDVLGFASFGGLARCMAWIPLHSRAFGACPKRCSSAGHRTRSR